MDSNVIKLQFDKDSRSVIENKELLSIRRWEVVKSEYPYFIITMTHPRTNNKYTFKLLSDYYPISLEIVDPITLESLPYTKCPSGGCFLDNHTSTHKPFLCAPRIREYHTYTSHCNEQQWVINNDNRLSSVLDIVYTFLSSAAS